MTFVVRMNRYDGGKYTGWRTVGYPETFSRALSIVHQVFSEEGFSRGCEVISSVIDKHEKAHDLPEILSLSWYRHVQVIIEPSA